MTPSPICKLTDDLSETAYYTELTSVSCLPATGKHTSLALHLPKHTVICTVLMLRLLQLLKVG